MAGADEPVQGPELDSKGSLATQSFDKSVETEHVHRAMPPIRKADADLGRGFPLPESNYLTIHFAFEERLGLPQQTLFAGYQRTAQQDLSNHARRTST